MAEDWAADVRKYAPDADESVIAGIVRHCGIALRTRDASLVSFTDPDELERVRESFLRRKLGLTEPDEVLDAAIAAVGEQMKQDPTKNRVTVYYLLAARFGKLALFGGAAAADPADPERPVAAPDPPPAPEPRPAAAPLAAAAAIPAAAPAAAAAGAAEGVAPASRRIAHRLEMAARMTSAPEQERRDDGGILGVGLATLVVLGLAILGAAVAGALIGGRTGEPPRPPAVAVAPAPTAAPAAAAIPEGAGVIAEMVDGRPKVSVYFETAKFDVTPEFPAVAAPVKAYVDANPGARLAVSGFNDPRGDPAFNAELAKNRAQAVKAALVGIGVPEAAIDLEKPPETTDREVSLAEARRVDIVVKDAMP